MTATELISELHRAIAENDGKDLEVYLSDDVASYPIAECMRIEECPEWDRQNVIFLLTYSAIESLDHYGYGLDVDESTLGKN